MEGHRHPRFDLVMRLSGSHAYPVPVETVIAMLRDRATTIAKYERMCHRDVEIVDFVSDDTALPIVSSRVVDVHGSPAHISGTMTLGPDETGSRHDVTLDVDVKIPLVGGKIADWVGKNDVRRTLDAEYVFNDGRLAPA